MTNSTSTPWSAKSELRTQRDSPWLALALVMALVSLAWGVAAAPLGVSIVAVFLCAGPHNWLEMRYFLSRLPGRFGPLANFSRFGASGVVLLTASFIGLSFGARHANWSASRFAFAVALWNSALIVWLLALALWRQQIPPRRHWPWLLPIAFGILAANWTAPLLVNVAIVYLHPLLALAFLDRELHRARSLWRTPYRQALWSLPICLLLIAWWQQNATPLVEQDMISMQIQRHVGAEVLPGLSPRLLVTWHAYLELLHYLVWIVALPAVTLRAAPWNLSQVPLARRSPVVRRMLMATIAVGGLLIAVLWGGFWIDYATTRDLYFTIAVFHVIAEGPMLLRLL